MLCKPGCEQVSMGKLPISSLNMFQMHLQPFEPKPIICKSEHCCREPRNTKKSL